MIQIIVRIVPGGDKRRAVDHAVQAKKKGDL